MLPEVTPIAGVIDVIDGAAEYVYPFGSDAVTPRIVTDIVTVLVPAGAMTWIAVAVLEMIVAAVDPNVTDVAFDRFVPVSVTTFPPLIGP